MLNKDYRTYLLINSISLLLVFYDMYFPYFVSQRSVTTYKFMNGVLSKRRQTKTATNQNGDKK